VSDALNRRQLSSHDIPGSSNEDSSGSSRGKKRRPQVLLSSFLKKKKKGNSSIQVWDKDIVCFPKDYMKHPHDIPIPRGKTRMDLNKKGLIGKVRLTSDMGEGEVRE
jgi:hypothetical protein